MGGSANSSHKCGIIMIRIWAKVMAENVLLSSPRWADKQMPDPGLALRQEAKIRPATAPGDLLSRPISGAKKNSLTIVTRSLDADQVIPRYLFPFQSLQSSFCGRTNSRRGSKICETKHLFLICKTSKQQVKRMMIRSAVGSHTVKSRPAEVAGTQDRRSSIAEDLHR